MPPVRLMLRCPVTGGTIILATLASVVWWIGWLDISLLWVDGWWPGRPWRLVAGVLPHVNIIHLAFNLYWLSWFGVATERVFGHIKTLGLFLLLAAGSSAAEYAFLKGGVGLSGVVYGLFGFLWVLGQYDPRFPAKMSKQTIALFVAWFFLCIALTVTDVMPVGNIAHGAGAVLGILLGYAVAGRQSQRRLAAPGLALLIGVALVLAGAGRPYVNRVRPVVNPQALKAYEALTKGDDAMAVHLYRQALSANKADASCWHNLGIAFHRLGRYQDAADAYEHAVQLNPSDSEAQAALEWCRAKAAPAPANPGP